MFLAKLYGAVFLAMGLGILFNSAYYKKTFEEMLKDKTYIFLGGIMALIIGLVMVLKHNVWESSWVVIITLFGWIGLVKGVSLLVFPSVAGSFKPWFYNKSFLMVLGVGTVILGAVLSYFGWFV